MEIIKATAQHLEDVYMLLCELQEKTFDKDDFSKIYQENINSQNIHYILAVHETKVVGFASLHIQRLLHHCAPVGELQEIVVAKEQRGLGAGALLFNEIKKLAASHKCLQLELCSNFTRAKAHEFFLNQGMKKSHYKFTQAL
ncbi:MAG: GNAT family N-acetyltransferase [Defluviitaleaceae bacterium]|nr:GNAT family N-acetyltransferase [Defluviitaleaceae bacterium]